MAFKPLVFLSCFYISLVSCMTSSPRAGHGLIGYGITMYNPACAYSCRASIASSPLNCTMPTTYTPNLSIGSGVTTSDCYATDDAFLQTLAWCISTHCTDISPKKLEKYWKMNVAGTAAVQPDPKESYQEALDKIPAAPNKTLISGSLLTTTSLVAEEDYISNLNGMLSFESQEDTHERYGLVLILSGAVIPITLSLVRFIPWPARLTCIFNAYLIYPPAFGPHHNEAILSLFHILTRGQAFFILYLISINIILSSISYRSTQPNSWFPDDNSGEILTYLSNRLGVLSFANIPLLILYAGRNNILLYVTNWSQGTFLLLHRWVAFLCTIEAVIHSVIYLQVHIPTNKHSDQSNTQALIWGSIATLSMVILLPTSIYPIRKKIFELFHAWHVLLASLTLAGCYWHIVQRFQHQWGYELWIIVAVAVWGFDRVMRIAKLAWNGLRTATVTVIDEEYIQLDVKGVSGNGHAYLYFPTLTWLIWENHPFSVVSTAKERVKPVREDPANTSAMDLEENEKQNSSPRKSMTFLIRTRSGITSKLRSHASIPVLVESPYHSPFPSLSNSSYDHLICFAGGVGITALTSYLLSHQGRKKLFWGAHGRGIVDKMENMLEGVEKEVWVGGRMDVRGVLEREVLGIEEEERKRSEDRERERVLVLVSGPEGLADEVRRGVVELGRKKGVLIWLVEEGFCW